MQGVLQHLWPLHSICQYTPPDSAFCIAVGLHCEPQRSSLGISFYPCSPKRNQCLSVWSAVCSGPEHHHLHILDSATGICQAPNGGISIWESEIWHITSPKALTNMRWPGSPREEDGTLGSRSPWGRVKYTLLAVGLTCQAPLPLSLRLLVR